MSLDIPASQMAQGCPILIIGKVSFLLLNKRIIGLNCQVLELGALIENGLQLQGICNKLFHNN